LIPIKTDHRPPRSAEAGTVQVRSSVMMDIAMLAIGFVFFALSIGYVYGCDRL
jgi:hypothetical protein